MAWVFRANASLKERIFTLLALAWVALAIYGMTSNFVAESGAKVFAAYAAVPLCLIFFIPILLDRHPSNKIPMLGTVKRACAYLLILLFAYGFAWAGLALGSASLLTRALGTEFSGPFKVIGKSDGSWKRRECDYSLRLQDVASDWNTKACVAEEFWATVQKGDVLLAEGRRSSLGAMLVSLSASDRR